MRWIALLVLPLLAQDPADRVRALIEKLGAEEIADREAAQAELIKLGGPALPAIRPRLEKSAGEVKARLEKVVAQIEYDVRVAGLLEPGPRVTLSTKDRPAAEVFADLGRQSGIRVEVRDLPPGTKLTLDVKDAIPAEAVDEACRAHGNLMYAWSRGHVVVFAAPYRRVNAFDRGPYRLLMDGLVEWTSSGGSSLSFNAGLAGPPDRFPHSATLVFESALDDQGVNRLPSSPLEIPPASLEYPPSQEAGTEVFRTLSGSLPAPFPDKVARVACRGYASLKFVMNFVPRVVVLAPVRGASAKSDDVNLQVNRWDLAKRNLRAGVMRIELPLVRPKGAPVPGYYVVQDARGATVAGQVFNSYPSWRPNEKSTWFETVDFVLPEGFEPAKLILGRIDSTEEIRIPFALTEALR